MSVKEKKGTFIALCQEDCKQDNWQLFNQILSVTETEIKYKFVYFKKKLI